jgi:predicted ATP-grasp superfamily ATP-dependent carboligase
MKISSDFSKPVLVLPSVHHGGLGITRSLGRLGVPVYQVAPGGFCPASSSRYSSGHFRWDAQNAPAERTVEFLLGLANKIGGRPLLIPTSDTSSLFIAEHTAALRDGFCFPHMDASLVRALCSKKEMFHLARRFHIPTPDAFFPQSHAEALGFARNADFPIMIKAIDDQLLRSRGSVTKVIARNRQELIKQYKRMEDPVRPNLIFQEYIPGGEDSVWMFNGYFDQNSECRLGFTGKKIRQFPANTGATSLGICLRNETVAHTTEWFMKAAGYRGILDIDYRYDARDGLYKVLDVNPRIGSTFRLFVGEAGMDVARALYCDMTGQPVAADSAREGRKWLVEDFDLLSCLCCAWYGRLPLRNWLTSYRGVGELAGFASDDPLPLLPMLFDDAHAAVRRVLGRSLARRRQVPVTSAAREGGIDALPVAASSDKR